MNRLLRFPTVNTVIPRLAAMATSDSPSAAVRIIRALRTILASKVLLFAQLLRTAASSSLKLGFSAVRSIDALHMPQSI
jgi:hypothetical protein